MGDPYTTPDFAAAALVTIDTQRDTLDGGPLEGLDRADAHRLCLNAAS